MFGSHTTTEGRSLCILVSGRVRVHIRSKELLKLEKVTIFRDITLLKTESRSTSVTTPLKV